MTAARSTARFALHAVYLVRSSSASASTAPFAIGGIGLPSSWPTPTARTTFSPNSRSRAGKAQRPARQAAPDTASEGPSPCGLDLLAAAESGAGRRPLDGRRRTESCARRRELRGAIWHRRRRRSRFGPIYGVLPIPAAPRSRVSLGLRSTGETRTLRASPVHWLAEPRVLDRDAWDGGFGALTE
jgi:hypothetical protein